MTSNNRRPQAPAMFGRNAALVAAVLGWLSYIYLFGAALIWLIPETKGRPLPE